MSDLVDVFGHSTGNHNRNIGSNGRAAWAYVERLGWPVLAVHSATGGCCSCFRGAACRNSGKHPHWHPDDLAHGLLSATTDSKLVERWWERWPDASIAVPTGAVSGFIALDIDPRHGGTENLALLEGEHGCLPHSVRAISGSAGRHYLFKHPGGRLRSRTGAGAIRPGVELKADGGYIVVAPSLHASGRRYAWEPSGRPWRVPIAQLPEWLTRLLPTAAETVSRPRGWIANALANLAEGNRHNTFVSLAGWLARWGATDADMLALLEPHAEQVGFERDELARIVASINRYAPAVNAEAEALSTKLGGMDFRLLKPEELIW